MLFFSYISKATVMKSLLIFVLAAVVIVGCRPSTEITASWRNPEFLPAESAGNIQTIFVTAMTDRPHVREKVEHDLADALSGAGYKTIEAMNVLPPKFTTDKDPDKKKLLEQIRETGAQAILTVALIDEKTETRYNSDYSYAPVPRFGFYGTFWGYYNNWYPTLNAPGYYTQDKVYFIETNLYDAKTEKLLWSAQSRTYDPQSLEAFSENFAQVVVEKMHDEGLLARNPESAIASDRDEDKE